MDTLAKLIEQFRQFPGIGPRQARRFVYFLLAQPASTREDLAGLVRELSKQIRTCTSCFRFFPIGVKASAECAICSSSERDRTSLLVVCRDADFEHIEKSHTFNGTYFILGGAVPILEKNPENRIRAKELVATLEKRAKAEATKADSAGVPIPLKEVILALNATPEGENTQFFIEHLLEPLVAKYSLKISTLGRGLSTGLELEYSDSETLKNALKNRT